MPGPGPAEVLAQRRVDGASYRAAIARFASGVTLVTANGADDRAVGMTASAVTSLSLDPIQLLVCVSSGLPTLAAIEAAGGFAVNVLGEGHEELAMRFATPDVDRFAGVSLRPGWSSPVLEEAIAVFDCRVAELLPGGDHTIVVGEVDACDHDPEGRPLVYWSSRFSSLS
jgi:flavin reductase (DIM6/NTAB) family NADH-FMN oxidoreductase RutF